VHFLTRHQVLSARVDLLPPAYLTELKRLQDAVAPFPEPVRI
jgi:predicted unusual protein kinase regulating ubiquinone biosynthesis (AarF/ABC1/UbiB family)